MNFSSRCISGSRDNIKIGIVIINASGQKIEPKEIKNKTNDKYIGFRDSLKTPFEKIILAFKVKGAIWV